MHEHIIEAPDAITVTVQSINAIAFANNGPDFDVNCISCENGRLRISECAMAMGLELKTILENIQSKTCWLLKSRTERRMEQRYQKMVRRGWAVIEDDAY